MIDKTIQRRSFLKLAAAATVGTKLPGLSSAALAGRKNSKLRKALQLGMLPKRLSDADKFRLARKCGFEGIEGSPIADFDAVRRILANITKP